jgi:hypothetical protein
MRSIHKYPLALKDIQQVEMPRDAEPLSVQLQMDTICVWALVNPGAERELRTFHIVGTGNPFPIAGHLHFLGTVQMDFPVRLVWHVFLEVK